MKKRILSCALTLVMLLSLMPTTAFAAEKHHTYYSKKFEITGNQAVDICNVAKAQKGKTEAQLHYNGAKWCASFVGDCARLAGIPQSVIPEAPLCDNMYQGVMNGGGKEIASLSKCQPGDLVFYKNPPGSDRIYCHVAIIISNKAGEKNSIHGNLLESGTYKVYQMKYTGYTDLAGNPYPAVFVRPAYKNTGSTTGTTTPSTPSTDPAKTYTVRYNANGGSGTMKDTKVTYGTATTLTANAFTRSGYDFVGWFAQRASDGKWGYKNGSSTKWFAEGKQTSGYYKNLYANKGSSSNATSVNGDVVTLYAQWVKFGLDTSNLEVTKSQAHVYTSLKKPAGVPISQAGIYLWEKGKTQPTSPTYKESYSSYDNYISKTSLPINYTIGKGKEVNVALKEGTTYNYKIVCTAGKASLTTETGTFTTPGTPTVPPESGAVGGIVADMNEIILKTGSPKIWVNGTSKVIDAQGTVPVIRSSRTLLPVRAVFEAMGGTVGWDNDTRTVSLELNGKTLYLQIDNSHCKDSLGKTYTLDSPPAILNSRTMLPIRFVVEYFGGTVDWDGGTQSVIIQYKK